MNDESRDAATPEEGAPAAGRTAKPRRKAERVLPTDRIAFPKQMDILRAYGQLGDGGKTVTNAAVAGVVGLSPNTTSLANSFFIDVGLLNRGPDGQVPSPDVVAYARAHEWGATDAPAKLAPLLSGTWFASALLPKVRFRAYSMQETMLVLSEAAGASSSHRSQLQFLVDLMAAAGLVDVEGDQVRGRRQNDRDLPAPVANPPAGVEPDRGAPPPRAQDYRSPRSDGGAFNINLSLTLADIASLAPEKIAAFMGGLAELMKLSKEIEKLRADAAEEGDA